MKMSVREYIGARYVPVFAEPIQWDKVNTYDPLTIVLNEGNSYTSRQYVPAGIDISNEDFWALTGNYNAQIEQYRKEVGDISAFLSQFTYVYPSTESVITDSPVFQPGDIVKVYGFNSFGDGGECEYKVSNTKETDISVAVGNMYMNIIPKNGMFNSKAAGLFPKESTDQKVLMDAVLNASASLKAACVFDEGTYYFSNINMPEGSSIIGAASKREYQPTVFTTIGQQSTTFITMDNRYTSIKNIHIIESSTSQRTNGVVVIGAIYGSVENLTIEGFENSITLQSLWNFSINDVTCTEFRNYGFYTQTLVNNLLASNIHCTCTDTTPKTNFCITAGNALTILNPTSEGNSPVHFALDTKARGVSIVGAHMESGQTMLSIINGLNTPNGSVSFIGGIFFPQSAIPAIVSNSAKFVDAPVATPLYSLNITGLTVNTYDQSTSTFLPDDYFVMNGVQNLTHSITLINTGYVGGYAKKPCDVINGKGLGSTFPVSTFGANQGLDGGNLIVRNGKPYEYSFVKRINGTTIGNAQPIATITQDNQFAVNVKVFQSYDNFSYEQQYAEYMVMVSKDGTLKQATIVTSDNFTITFAYEDGVLKASSTDNYGNYRFECTVISVSNFG